MLIFTGLYLFKSVGFCRPINPVDISSKDVLQWEGLLTNVGSLLGRTLLGPLVSGVPVSPLQRFGSAEIGQGLVNSSIDTRGIFSYEQRLGLINLTVSLITAEIIGLCQRSGSFSNWGQGLWELEAPSEPGVSQLDCLSALWWRLFSSALDHWGLWLKPVSGHFTAAWDLGLQKVELSWVGSISNLAPYNGLMLSVWAVPKFSGLCLIHTWKGGMGPDFIISSASAASKILCTRLSLFMHWKFFLFHNSPFLFVGLGVCSFVWF